jgi:hypothetical protein
MTVRSLKSRMRRLGVEQAGRPCRVCGLAWVGGASRGRGSNGGGFAGHVVWRFHGPEGASEIDLGSPRRLADPPPCACAGCGRENVVHVCDPVGVLGFVRAEAAS